MLLIVGLGNPTEEYQNTFHNMGFMAVDKIAEKLQKKLKKAECSSLTSVFSVKGEKVVLAKPLTYMNLSGLAVKSLMQKHGATLNDLIVIYDDFDLPRFTLRARASGGPGTHNGMRNIVAELQSEDFKRIRVGIGGTEVEKKDYVLSNISKGDGERFEALFYSLAEEIQAYISKRDFDALMRGVNVLK